MSKHFGPQHAKNGYAAMGGSLSRPCYGAYGIPTKRSVQEAIASEARKAARMQAAKGKK